MICLYALVFLVAFAATQKVESIHNPNAEAGCNVVNVHFGKSDQESSNTRGEPGPPGKRGPVGPRGIQVIQITT